MERVRQYIGLMMLAALAWVWTLPAQAMNKAELIEAMASHAGLWSGNGEEANKTEAREFLKKFSLAVSKQLCPEDKCGVEESLVLSGFGAFWVAPEIDAQGDVSSGEVEFVPGPAFHASDDAVVDPYSLTVERIGGPGDLDSDDDGLPDLIGDGLVVFGDGMGPVRAGDIVVVNDPPRNNPGKGRGRPEKQAEVVAVLVAPERCCKPLVIDVWERGASVGLVLRGIDKKDIRRGMRISTSPDQPGDEPIVLAELSKSLGITDEEVINRYIVLLTLIVDEVNAGGSVEVGDLGQFFQEARATVQVVDACPGDICRVEYEVDLGITGESPESAAALASSISKRSARTGRNPQTGKEIKIAAKNRVKFKAGAELSK